MPAKTIRSFSPTIHPNDERARSRAFPEPLAGNGSEMDIITEGVTALSPPPTLHSSRTRPKKLLLRLKSDPCLREHADDGLRSPYSNLEFTQGPNSPISPMSTGSASMIWRPDPPENLHTVPLKPGRIRQDKTSLAFPPFNVFGSDVMKAVVQDPVVVSRLCAFAESRGGARDVEFLQKIQEYNQAIKALASAVSSISASFVGLAARSPIDLPTDLWKDLNTDLKQVGGSILPGLGGLLKDAERYVEQRLSAELYPDFLISQISKSLHNQGQTSAWDRDNPNHSFCLTNPYEPENPVVYASDGFLNLTGYSQGEILSRNCRFLQGPNTRYTAISRIRDGLLKGEETTELVLNYCKDGHGFWNLLFIAPLVDSDGVLQYHLGGQIDVTNMLSCKEDLLKLLVSTDSKRDCSFTSRDLDAKSSIPKSESSGKRPARKSASPQRLRTKPSRTNFFQGFRRQPFDDSLLSPASATIAMSRSEPDLLASGSSNESWSTNKASGVAPHPSDASSPYSRFIVLRVLTSVRQTPAAKRDRGYMFSVAFCSSSSAELFGVTQQDLLHRDIFDVLADVSSQPTSTKSFRSIARDQLMGGNPVKFDLTVRDHAYDRSPAEKHKKTGMASFSHWSIFSTEASHPRENSLGRDEAGSTTLTSYWTPLKDGDGVAKWVVVVLTPAGLHAS